MASVKDNDGLLTCNIFTKLLAIFSRSKQTVLVSFNANTGNHSLAMQTLAPLLTIFCAKMHQLT